MNFILQVIKVVGGLAGLFSAGFLIWDRFTKHYPTAVFVAYPLIEGGSRAFLHLRVKNHSDRPIILNWQNAGRSKLTLASDSSALSLVEAGGNVPTALALDQGAETDLPVVTPSNLEDIDDDNILDLTLLWKHAQPRIWCRSRQVRVKISKRDLITLLEKRAKITLS